VRTRAARRRLRSQGSLLRVPLVTLKSDDDRRAGAARETMNADRFRDLLVRFYGPERAAVVKYAEAFEGCEYGAPLTEQNSGRLFPF